MKRERRATFDRAAELYERARPGYPDDLMQEEQARERLFDLIRARIGDRTARKSYLATLDVAVRT